MSKKIKKKQVDIERDESRSKAILKMNEEKRNGTKDNARGYRTQVAQSVVRELQRW